jgi:hypothetical protein
VVLAVVLMAALLARMPDPYRAAVHAGHRSPDQA